MKTVTAAILIIDGRILIAKRRLGDRLAEKWEFPGGKIEQGETPEQCLGREMQEEFQIQVSIGKFLGESIYHYDHGSIRLIAYRTYWEKGELIPKAHEEYQWVSKDQLKDYDFAPADIPFVEMLRKEKLIIDQGVKSGT
jgi:8-oxo-dGTP diphosphatase